MRSSTKNKLMKVSPLLVGLSLQITPQSSNQFTRNGLPQDFKRLYQIGDQPVSRILVHALLRVWTINSSLKFRKANV